MSLGPAQITARSVEIAKGLTSLTPSEAVHAEFALGNTRLTGVLARAGATLRGQEKTNGELLRHVATTLGISWPEMDRVVLPELEELGWIETKRQNGRLDRLTERVPDVDELLTILGKRWEEEEPTDHDLGSVTGLHALSRMPFTKEAFSSELKVGGGVVEEIIDFGVAGTYMSQHQDTLWSPLFWQRQEPELKAFFSKPDNSYYKQLGGVTDQLRARPGLPFQNLGVKDDFVDPIVLGGFFPTVSVATPNQKYTYLFPPQAAFAGDGEAKSDLFEKARLIVGALRHGQFNADVTRIRSPLLVLSKLRDGSMGAHSHGLYQYASLATNGIVSLEPVNVNGQERWKTSLIPTTENQQAAELADMMLRGGEKVMGDISDPEIRLLFGRGLMAGSAKARVERRRLRVAATDELVQLAKALRKVKY